MRKKNALAFALCGTLLLVLLAISGRLIYMNIHTQTLDQIIGKDAVTEIVLSENDIAVRTVTEQSQIDAVKTMLGVYTYVEYPHLFHPGDDELGGSRLKATFSNKRSISVTADGYVFVNDKLRDVEGSRGKELYHKLYLLAYPTVVAAE